MIDRLARPLTGLTAPLLIAALLHLDLVFWALVIDAGGLSLRPDLNGLAFVVTLVLTATVLFRPALLTTRWVWPAYLAIAVWCVASPFPYGSNLYYVWVWIDLLLASTLIAVAAAERRRLVLAAGARWLIVAVFGVAVLQKLSHPSFLDGSFYLHTFSSSVFGAQLHAVAAPFTDVDLAEHVLTSGRAVATDLKPDLPVGSAVTVPIVDTPALRTVAGLLVSATLAAEAACAVLFALPCRRPIEPLRHGALLAFLLGTYWILPVIVDWGWALCVLAMLTAPPRWRVAYLAAAVVLLGYAAAFAPEVVRLTVAYSQAL